MAYKRRLRFDKRIKFQKKMNIIYILLLIVLASIGTGYAYIKSNLNITGTANVTAASWDVHFENLNVTTGSVTATTPANITDDTTVEFSAELSNPNDFYEFTVDVVNDGTIDAMIDNFSISPTLTTAQAKYLEYTIAYSDGTPLANKQELKSNESEIIIVHFKYKENSDTANYPTTDQTFTISFSVDYTQADNTSEIVRTYLYRSNPNSVYIGSNVSELGTYYTTAQDVINNAGHNNFIRHRISNNQIVQSDVGVFYGNTIYYLIGGNEIFYATNKAILNSIFGSANCEVDSSSDIVYSDVILQK